MDNDTEMEQDIAKLNLTAPRVTPEHIQELMNQVEYKVHIVEGTTTTQAVAVLDGFTLATGSTSCVDPNNFNKELGAKYAIKNAECLAKDKLYELEGYRLKFANKD